MQRGQRLVVVLAVLALACGDTESDRSGGGNPDSGVCESACYTGAPATRGLGACHDGVRSCEAPGTCAGEVLPVTEDCDTPLDDDCDGEINESDAGCTCAAGATEECYSGALSTKGVGACVAGTHTCDATGLGWGSCIGEIVPGTETCTSPLDDDCDGEVNEEGSDCVCETGSTQACYGGPANVIGKGACQAGAQTCTGLAWSACQGEVLPGTETCATWFDDDCDDVPECLGDISWLLQHGDADAEYPIAIADNPVNAGTYVLMQSGDHAELRTTDELAPQPTLELVKSYPAQAHASAMSRELCTTIAGRYSGAPDFGQGPVPAGSNDLFLVLMVPAQPDLVIAHPSLTGSIGASILVGGSGCDPLIVGTLDGTLNFGSGSVSSPTPAPFVASFNVLGTNVSTWLLATASTGSLEVTGIYGGRVVGKFSGTVNFGTGALVSAGGTDAFLVELGDGIAQSAQRFGGPLDDAFTGISEIGRFVVGHTAGGMDLGQGALPAGGVMASFDPAFGLWSASFPGCPLSQVTASFLYPYVIGSCATSTDLGSGLLPAGRFMAAVGEAGVIAWSRPIPSNTDHLLIWGSNTYWPRLTGSFTGQLDWMGNSFTSNGGEDVFLAEIHTASAPL